MRSPRINWSCFLSSNVQCISTAVISMSGDMYFGDDEDTSAEVHVHGSANTVEISSYMTPEPQQSDSDDVFEGEIDPSAFESPNSESTEMVPGRAAGGVVGAVQDFGYLQQQSVQESLHTLTRASGGLGDGDAPYDENSSKRRHREAAPGFDDFAYQGEGAEKDPPRTPDQWRRQMEQHGYRKHEWYSAYVSARALKQRRERLKELSGETFGLHRQENQTFSPSANSESISISDDEQHAQPATEINKQKSTSQSFAAPCHSVQAVSSKAAKAARRQETQPNECGHNTERLVNVSSSTASRHSSLSHPWTHLSEVTPVDVQGHHPSIITRSPRKVSRASSLASEGGLDAAQDAQSLTEAALREKDKHGKTRILSGFQGTDLQINPRSLLYPIPDKALSSPFRRPDAKSSASSSRSSPLRRPTDLTNAASAIAVTESPMPPLPATPYRPDTPRPSADLEKLEELERSYAQLRSPPMPSSESESLESSTSRTAYLNEWWKPGRHTYVAVADPLLPDVNLVSSIPHGWPTNYVSPYGQDEVSHRIDEAAISSDRPFTLPQKPQISQGERVELHAPLHAPWLNLQITPGICDGGPPQAQTELSSRVLLHSNPIELPELAHVIRKHIGGPPDLIAIVGDPTIWRVTSSDVVPSSVPTAGLIPSLSPLSQLQDAIQTSRGLGKVTATKRKPVKEPTSTRGRAVSHSHKKDKNTTTTSNVSTTGIQGEDTRITKSRAKKPTRSTSRRIPMPKHKSQGVDKDVPEVPNLPEDMSLNVPNLHPRGTETQMCTKGSRKGVRDSSSTHSTPGKTLSGEKKHNDDAVKSLHTPAKEQAISPSTRAQQLSVPKTRMIGKPATTTTPMKTPPHPNKIKRKTDSPHTPKHSPMEIDIPSPAREHNSTQSQTKRPNKQAEPTTPSTKKRPTTRKATPGGINKPRPRKPKTPVRLPTHRPDEIEKLLETTSGDQGVEQPETSAQIQAPIQAQTQTQTPSAKPKPKATPRKATPAPRKRIHKEAADDVVPPVPVSVPALVTPKVTRKSDVVGGDGGLTPQSAEGGQSRTPLRRSPRLSGVEPEAGL